MRLIPSPIRDFIGYGNLEGKIWFIGLEEGFQSPYVKPNHSDFEKYLKDFEITQEMLEDFLAIAKENDVEINEEHYQKDLPYYKTLIKGRIARNLWGRDEFSHVLLGVDPQVLKAIEMFPKAVEFARMEVLPKN